MKWTTKICLVILLLFASAVLIGISDPTSTNNIARFGYYWMNNTLPYDTEFSYFFDVAVYPDGVFADSAEHYFAYITAQNKHIVYDGVPYGVEAVLQYGYNANNINSIKRVWVNDYDDGARFSSYWIDSDADGVDYWELSTLNANGYLGVGQDAQGDTLKFLRVQAQTIFISETDNPIQSTWENRFYFYNFTANQWQLKVKNSFTLPAERQTVRNFTYSKGSGIWAGILETEGGEGGPPDFGKPPIKKIVYMNRWIKIVDQGITSLPNLDIANNIWIEPQSPYELFYRSQPIYSEFSAGSASIVPVELLSFNVTVTKNSAILNWKTATEINNYGFEIEKRRQSQILWDKIGFVQGHGNSNSEKNYSFIDNKPQNGKIQYRLKQIDSDGSYEYSSIVEVEVLFQEKFKLTQNYPNPFNPQTTISYSLPQTEYVSLKVYDVLGNEIATLVNEEKSSGNHSVLFSGSNLASGIYFCTIQAGTFVKTNKMILAK